jgi:hypothetical protein
VSSSIFLKIVARLRLRPSDRCTLSKTGLHEAAVEAGGVAAAEASSAAVAMARGSDASPLAVIAEQEGDADG